MSSEKVGPQKVSFLRSVQSPFLFCAETFHPLKAPSSHHGVDSQLQVVGGYHFLLATGNDKPGTGFDPEWQCY